MKLLLANNFTYTEKDSLLHIVVRFWAQVILIKYMKTSMEKLCEAWILQVTKMKCGVSYAAILI